VFTFFAKGLSKCTAVSAWRGLDHILIGAILKKKSTFFKKLVKNAVKLKKKSFLQKKDLLLIHLGRTYRDFIHD